MACVETRSRGRKCLGRVDYFESADLPHGVLPTNKAVIEVMLYLLRPRRAGQSQRSRSNAADMLASVLQEHWIFCNLYTISKKNIKKHITKLYEDFLKLLQTRDSRKNESYDAKVLAFNRDSAVMFDIFCTDACQRRKFENFYDVRMTENEWKFLEDQRGERKMYSQDHVDTQWTKTMTRRNNDLFALERMWHSVNAEQPMAVPESTETTEDTSDSADELYTPVTVEDATEVGNNPADSKIQPEEFVALGLQQYSDELPQVARVLALDGDNVTAEWWTGTYSGTWIPWMVKGQSQLIEGVRQQIDSHPPPLPPVEEMHTKPSQHAHVHIDEAPVALSSSVSVFGIQEPLTPLLGQRAQEKPLLDDMVLSDDLPDPSKPDNTFTFDLHEVGPHPMPHPSQVNDVSNKKMELEKDAASCVNSVFMFYPFNAQMTDKRARRLTKVLPTGLIGKVGIDVEMSPVVLMDQVPRPFDSDDKLLDQEAIFAGNVAVGGEQASMNEAMIEGDQGQGQMVEQCGDVMVVEAGTSPSHLVCTEALNNLLNGSNPSGGTVQVYCNNKPNKLDAMVVCRDLNLNYNSVVALCKAYFGPGPGSILLDNAIGVQNSLSSNDAGGGKNQRCGGDVRVKSGSLMQYTPQWRSRIID
ncbi:hypothetical protein EMCRGX_G030420 [Ephydatia muelleri]